MKLKISYLLVPLLILTTGCSTHISSVHDYDYGHRGHMSVGVHGNKSGAAVVGALIVGGIIGSAINESKHQKEKQALANKSNQRKSKSTGGSSELVDGYAIEEGSMNNHSEKNHLVNPNKEIEDYGTELTERGSQVQWYQTGKDGNCYLMGIDKGVTDVISAVPASRCQ